MSDTIARLRTLQSLLEFVLEMIPAWVDESPGGEVVYWLMRLVDQAGTAEDALAGLAHEWTGVGDE